MLPKASSRTRCVYLLSTLDLLRNALLGYDLDEFEVDAAVTALEKGELEATREQLRKMAPILCIMTGWIRSRPTNLKLKKFY